MALYRKYRPATFAEVVGQEHVTDPLSTALDTGRISHAYLFSGPRGCGKTSSARILARSLNCVEGPTSRPCGVCPSCEALAPGGSGNLDVIELDAASHGGVDDTRELRDRAFYAPAESRYRVFIVDEAHMVTTAGFNALLKIVEEPPAHLIFIFATTEPEKVLPTIRSRTHHYPFRLLPPATMRGLLGTICDQEQVRVEESVYPLVIRAGGGSPRDSLSVLDQLLAGAGPEGVTYPRALALLGVTDIALIDEAVDALAADDGATLFATVDRVVEAGHDPRRFATDLLERIRDLILLRAVPDAAERNLVTGPGDVIARMSAQADRIGAATLARYAELLHEGLGDMRGATAPRLLLEVVCARMLLPGVSEAESATLQRLERLERRVESGAVPAAGAVQAPAQADREPAPSAPVGGAPAASRPSGEPRRRGAEVLAAMREQKNAAPHPAQRAQSPTGPQQSRPQPAPDTGAAHPDSPAVAGSPESGAPAANSERTASEAARPGVDAERDARGTEETVADADRTDVRAERPAENSVRPDSDAERNSSGAEQQARGAARPGVDAEQDPVEQAAADAVRTGSGPERIAADSVPSGGDAERTASGAEHAPDSERAASEAGRPADDAERIGKAAERPASDAERADHQAEGAAADAVRISGEAERRNANSVPSGADAEQADRRAERAPDAERTVGESGRPPGESERTVDAAERTIDAGRAGFESERPAAEAGQPAPDAEPITEAAERRAHDVDERVADAVRTAGGVERSAAAGERPAADAEPAAVQAVPTGDGGERAASERNGASDRHGEDSERAAGSPMRAPESSPAEPSAAGATDTPDGGAEVAGAAGGDVLGEVEGAWADIRAKARESAATLHALLSAAAPVRVEQDTIVFAHPHAPLAERLSGPGNIQALQQAVVAVLGRAYSVRWEVGSATGSAGSRGQGSGAAEKPARGGERSPARGGSGQSPPRFVRPSQAQAQSSEGETRSGTADAWGSGGTDGAGAGPGRRDNSAQAPRREFHPPRGGAHGAHGASDDDIPPPEAPDYPDDPGPRDYSPVGYDGVPPALTPEEEQEMLAESARPVPPEQRRDPDEVALELLRTELGATQLGG